MKPEELHDALVDALRRGNLVTACLRYLGPEDLFEAQLFKALHTMHVLQIHGSEETREQAVKLLIHLRYERAGTGQSANRGSVPTQAETWVDMLLRSSGFLDGKLQRCVEEGVEVDDECVLLATISALAIRAVKGSFKATYVWLPWEEMEFLLVSFAASHSKLQPEVRCVANAERTRRHLQTFRTLVKQLRTSYCNATPDVLQSLAKKPGPPKRAEYLLDLAQHLQGNDHCNQSGVDTKNMEALHADCAVLRDWRSLREVEEALQVAEKALDPKKNSEWDRCGRLALPRALLLLGERVKNTWQSPHLSTHYVNRMELMLGDAVTRRLEAIRNNLLHTGHYFQQLESVRQFTAAEKESLLDDVKQARVAVSALLFEAAKAFEQYGTNEDTDARSMIQYKLLKMSGKGKSKMTWQGNVLEMLEKVKSSISNDTQRTEFEKLLARLKSEYLDNEDIILFQERSRHDIDFTNRSSRMIQLYLFQKMLEIARIEPLSTSTFAYVIILFRSLIFGTKFASMQKHVKLTANKPEEHKIDKESMMAAIRTALEMLKGADSSGIVTHYAKESALISAALWPDPDQSTPSPPCVVLAGPVLFGKLLRNYLAHKDFFVVKCLEPNTELPMLVCLLADGTIDPQHHGAQPLIRTAAEVEAEFNRLMQLVRAKCEMFECARCDDLDALKGMVKAHPYLDWKCKDFSGRTLLHVAAQGGHKDTVEWLLDQGVDPLAVDYMKRTALHMAATKEVAELLIKRVNNVGLSDLRGYTPFHCAAEHGRAEVVRFLLENDAAGILLEAGCNTGWTVLDLAAADGKAEAVEVLLENGAAVRERTLTCAADSGSVECVRLLLGRTTPTPPRLLEALQHAAQRGHLDVVDELLQSVQSDEERRDAARGALPFAAQHGQLDVLKALLEVCPEAGTWRHEDGTSLLHVAAASGSEDTVRFLIQEAPVTVLSRDKYDRTPLHWAAGRGHKEVVSILLAEIPNTNPLRHGKGERRSPLHVAAGRGHVGVVEELLDKWNWDVDEKDEDGMCALHWAAQTGIKEVLRLLLERGADRHVADSANVTPLHLAVQYRHIGAVRVLLEPIGKKQSAGELLDLLCREDDNGWNVLHWTAWTDNAIIAKVLVQREKNLTQITQDANHAPLASRRDKKGWTCLEAAVAFCCSPEIIKVFMDSLWPFKTDDNAAEVINVVNEAFAMAVQGDNLDLTKCMLDCMWQSERKNPPLSDKDKLGMIKEPLFLAVSEEIVRCILDSLWSHWTDENEADMIMVITKAFLIAVLTHNLVKTKCMLDCMWQSKGEKPVLPDKDRVRIVRYIFDSLWSHRTDENEAEMINVINEAFAMAVQRDNLVLTKCIHDWNRQSNRPEPMILKQCGGVTHLRRAVESNCSTDMVRLLLDCMWQSERKNPPLSDKDKLEMIEDALFLAVAKDRVGIARCILEWELQLEVTPSAWKKRKLGKPLVFRENKDGKTLLAIASEGGKLDLMKMLKSEECGMWNSVFMERVGLTAEQRRFCRFCLYAIGKGALQT